MRIVLWSCLLALLVVSCRKDEAVKTEAAKPSCAKPAGKKKLEMYSMSEMSLLMEQMFVDNQRLKERIMHGDTIGKFPQHFLQIHKAEMTDGKENDAFFKKQAQAFLASQQQIYQDPANAKQHFNDGVNACIACHQVKCTGPISRIRKLYIK